MVKLIPLKPLLVLLYGFPGSGKTFFARQICETLAATHVQSDRIRAELFETPGYGKDENHVVISLMNYMTGEFLSAGVSVVYDVNALRANQRRALRNMATKMGAETVLIWLQIDPDTALNRVTKRDRRKLDDHYAQEFDRSSFEHQAAGMQNPEVTERYLVISGKHVFNTQKSAFIRHLLERNLVNLDPGANQIGKPGLVNLVPNPRAGRVDLSRRNITIR
ncbi:MAG TPA: ATP-binding protein [Candidatus Saccharimonadales bacterium]|nr:ATP-binding protein [Candidatus Saccharimonadales bacterium]